MHINNEKLVSTTPIISTRPSSTTPTHHNLSLSDSLNFERVLLSSIHARTHEKLESLQALLVFDGIYTDGFRPEYMFFRKDVRLRRSDDNTPEADGTTDHFQGSSMLLVRMVSTTPPDYVAISVDIKNGRFVLALSSAQDAGSSGGGDRALSLARAEREINADVRNCRDVLVELRCMVGFYGV